MVALHIERDRFREADDAHLGRRIVGLADIADQPGVRGEVDHRARALLAEVLGRGAGDVEIAGQMDAEHRVPFLRAHLVENAVAQDAGDVDHPVDPAEGIDRLRHHRLGIVPFGDAAAIEYRLAASRRDLVDHPLGRTGVRTLALDRGT